MYKPVDPKVDFPKMEEAVLRFWQENRIFEKSIWQRAGRASTCSTTAPRSPPGCRTSATSCPAPSRTSFRATRPCKGRQVERRFGWDCHGLPVEYEMEKELGISGKREIEKLRGGQVQRGLPLHRAALHPGVAHDHHPPGPLGGLRPRLQDHGPRLHGVHLVGHHASCGRRGCSTRATTSCRTARAAPRPSPTSS